MGLKHSPHCEPRLLHCIGSCYCILLFAVLLSRLYDQVVRLITLVMVFCFYLGGGFFFSLFLLGKQKGN